MEERDGMQFSIPQDQLKHALEVVTAGVGRATYHSGFIGSLLMSADVGRLTFTVADYETILTYTVPDALVDVAGEAVVPAKLFKELAEALSQESVDVTANLVVNVTADGEEQEPILTSTLIRCKRSRSKLKPTCDAEAFPLVEEAGGEAGDTFYADHFAKAVDQVSFAAAKPDGGRPALTGVCFERTGEELALVATDGLRLAAKEIPRLALKEGAGGEGSVVVPASSLDRLVKVLRKTGAEEVTMRQAGDRVVFTTEGTTMSIATIEASYPRWRQIVPAAVNFSFEVTPQDVRRVLNQARLFADGLGRRCMARFHLDSQADGLMRISSRDAETGGYNGQVDVASAEGVFVDFTLDARFVLDVVQRVNGAVKVSGQSATSPLVLSDPTQNLTYLIMPFHTRD